MSLKGRRLPMAVQNYLTDKAISTLNLKTTISYQLFLNFNLNPPKISKFHSALFYFLFLKFDKKPRKKKLVNKKHLIRDDVFVKSSDWYLIFFHKPVIKSQRPLISFRTS
jgi:hypothetical protein